MAYNKALEKHYFFVNICLFNSVAKVHLSNVLIMSLILLDRDRNTFQMFFKVSDLKIDGPCISHKLFLFFNVVPSCEETSF